MSKIQKEDIKTEAQLIAAGATKASLPNDTQIYVTAGGLNKRLDEAIAAGDFSTTGFFTGVVIDYAGATEPTGWLFLSGSTIGNAASGATARANADTSALFTLLWNSSTNSELPVSSGRGGSAAADFAANKNITLPDTRGRALIGKDNMGGSTAGRITGGGSGITGTTLFATGGAETHTLSTAQIPSHTHSIFSTEGGAGAAGWVAEGAGGGPFSSVNTDATGSGGAHNNTQPTIMINKMIRL